MSEKSEKSNNVTNLHREPKRKKTNVSLLSDVPAIQNYLWRIGAEAKSPRTARITRDGEEDGYEREDLASIMFARDGTWHVKPELAPTEEEQEEITKALADFEFPTLKKVKKPKFPPEVLAAEKEYKTNFQAAEENKGKEYKTNVFEFRNLKNELVMIQVRVDKENGKKKYVPWTLWDDQGGTWRNVEPDEPLPLWGAEQLNNTTIAFLHEGAKAARACRDMVQGRSAEDKARLAAHPWGEALSHGAHLGWIGGATNPGRTDWSVFAKAKTFRIFAIADHDDKGENAIPKISKLLSPWDIDLVYVRFNSDFPIGFDLADDFPAKLFKKAEGRRIYTGPSFGELMRPATWATAPIPEPADAKKGRGRPKKQSFYLRPAFVSGWKVVTRPGGTLYLNPSDPTRILNGEAFNTATRPFSDVPSLAGLLDKHVTATVEEIAYKPGRPADKHIVTDKGRRAVNTWTPTRVVPFAFEPKGIEWPRPDRPAGMSDEKYKALRHKEYSRLAQERFDELAKPWHAFLEHLFPIDIEREHVKKVCATLIATPEQRMKFAMLLVSRVQGVGKTTLCDILRREVGEHNTSIVSQQDIESPFNSWEAHKRLIVAPEIFDAGNSWRTYQNLKSKITDDSILVNIKFLPQYEIDLAAFFIFCSNHRVPLKLEDTDRRYFVPQVTEQLKEKEYWIDLHDWLNGDGFGIIRTWAERYVAQHGSFSSADRAPETDRKKRLVDDSRARSHELIRKLGTVMMEQPLLPMPMERGADGSFKVTNAGAKRGVKALVVLDEHVRSWLEERLAKTGDRPPGLAMIRQQLEEVGLCISPKRFTIAGDYCHACANFELPDDVLGSNLKDLVTAPTVILENAM